MSSSMFIGSIFSASTSWLGTPCRSIRLTCTGVEHAIFGEVGFSAAVSVYGRCLTQSNCGFVFMAPDAMSLCICLQNGSMHLCWQSLTEQLQLATANSSKTAADCCLVFHVQLNNCAGQGVSLELQPRLVRAMAEAAGRYGHVMHPETSCEPVIQLAERLLSGVGQGWASRVFYSDDGCAHHFCCRPTLAVSFKC